MNFFKKRILFFLFFSFALLIFFSYFSSGSKNTLLNLANAIALNLIASLIFYFIVVFIPENKKKDELAPHLGMCFSKIIGDAQALFIEFNSISKTNYMFATITEAELERLCSSIILCGPGPIQNYVDGSFVNGTWFDYIYYRYSRSRKSIEEIFLYIVFLDSKLISILTEISSCSYFQQVEMYRHIISSVKPGTNLSFLSRPMFNYFQTIIKLNTFAQARMAHPKIRD